MIATLSPRTADSAALRTRSIAACDRARRARAVATMLCARSDTHRDVAVAVCRTIDAERRRPGMGWATLASWPSPPAPAPTRNTRHGAAFIVRRAAVARLACSSALPVTGGERVVRDLGGTLWHVREVDASGTPGARAARCLVFDNQQMIRRSWNVPPTWRRLSSRVLLALVDVEG